MSDVNIQPLVESSARMISLVSMDYRRYLCSQINWNDRLICIKGPKGTGKTTLILQHIRGTFGASSEKAVYLAADHIWFASHDIMDAVDYFHTHGYTHLFIDEVHHLPNWSRVIKTITDFYPQMNVVYSGSSILKLSHGSADLSRRQAVYSLKGLSFREYLAFTSALSHEAVSLGDVLKHHRKIANEICAKVRILPLFERYLASGYYPIFRSVAAQFAERLVEIVNTVLDVDFPSVEDVTVATIRKTKKMLMVLASSCPQQPNMSAIYRELETNRNLGLKMLDALERAELVATLATGADKLKNLSRPEKIYLGDTNLMSALVGSPQAGAVRETFFLNQVRAAGHSLVCPPAGDFLVDGKFLFEVGGKGKGFDQIKDVPNSYVVNDDVEVGFGNKIPLWLFGFLY
jgi:uncharacterized protein